MFNISVIIPLYNKKKYISRAVNSVLKQIYTNFELIVIDDGSTDNGANEVQKFKDDRIKLIHQNNQGVSAARNRGIEEAKAELVAFLDADDAWKRDFLETIINLRGKYPQAGAYGTAVEFKMPDGSIKLAQYKSISKEAWEGIIDNYFHCSLKNPFITASSVAIPKKVFKSVGEFPQNLARGEDLDMWCRIALEYPIAFANKICVTYYQNADDRACNKPLDDKNISVFLNKLEDYFSKYKHKTKAELYFKEYLIKWKIFEAREYIVRGRLKEARNILANYGNTKYFKGRWMKFYLITLMPNFIVKNIFYLNEIKNEVLKRI